MFTKVRVELADGLPEAVEDAVGTAGRHDVHIAELLGSVRVISVPRHHPKSTVKLVDVQNWVEHRSYQPPKICYDKYLRTAG